MERTHGTLPHLGPEGTCITSIHIPQSHGQSHCKGCWEIQRSSRILVSIEVSATVIICPILQLKKQRIRGMETWPKTLQLAWVGDNSSPGLSACKTTLLATACSQSTTEDKGLRPAEWQEGSHPGMGTFSGQSPQWINPHKRTPGDGQVRTHNIPLPF